MSQQVFFHLIHNKRVPVDVFDFPHITKFCDDNALPIYTAYIREAKEDEEPYLWGWKEPNEHLVFIFPLRFMVEMCFPYGYEWEEKQGNGKLVPIVFDSKIKAV